jgi:hypothetical protein
VETVRSFATALEALLAARGLNLNSSDRQRLIECRDFDRLVLWISRVSQVSSVEELFADN